MVQLTEVIISGSATDAETNLKLKEMQKSINKTVAGMPSKMQQVFKISRQEHLSHKEIAVCMNVSVETVKKHIHHALHLITAIQYPF